MAQSENFSERTTGVDAPTTKFPFEKMLEFLREVQ